MSGEDALSERPLRRSSSNLFTLGKMAGKGNNLASPPYFCKVSLDARGTGDTALGELGKYEEGWSGNNRLDQTIAYRTKDLLIYLCLSWKHLSSSLRLC
jgi:hypothetical protein